MEQFYYILVPVVAQGLKRVTVNTTGCGFDFHLGKLNIFFLWSGVEAKRGVVFRHSASNASRIQRKVVNGVL